MNRDQAEARILPFLKWAGGKRWFVENHLAMVPASHQRYIEPFLGSGAVFFAQNQRVAILSDLNGDLIATYRAIRDRPNEVQAVLLYHHYSHSSEHYYDTRSNKPNDNAELAGWFLYLNRTCWNGLYRVNKKNEFNVPKGTKTAVSLSTDDFVAFSATLKDTELLCCDFEETIDRAGENDFLFVDPPYTVKHNLNGFLKYNDHIFSWSDQVRLRDSVVRASDRGARILVTNADHESIRSLYEDIGNHSALKRATVISGKSQGRGSTTELTISIGL